MVIQLFMLRQDKSETNGQYPEGLMKIQKRQGYCLLLNVDGADYSKAELTVVYYEKMLMEYGKKSI